MGLVVFRCDASLRIGSGHIMRCRTLARALKRHAVESVFLCQRQPGDLIALLEEEFRVLVQPERPQTCTEAGVAASLSGGALYAEWLGCTEEQDAMDSLASLADAQVQAPTWLVVDHYALGTTWEQRMQEGLRVADGYAPAVLVLDDLADRPHHANVLMDANRLDPAAPDPYRDLVPEACSTLLGPAYALLDPLYPTLQPLLPARLELARVLVFFGGMDAANHAAVALEALSDPRLLHLAVDVVVGAAAPHRSDLESRVSQRLNTKLHVGLPSLAGVMARADLAVGAAGTASWERACLGLPCLLVPVAENQEQGSRALQTAGVARCCRMNTVIDTVTSLQEALQELMDTPEALQEMSRACLQLGDGRGATRVAATLMGPAAGMRLRPAQQSDLWLYHWWASDPRVRRQSLNSDPIPLAQHQRWFANRLTSHLALLRVLEDGNGLPIGQIRFERAAATDSRAVISFSLDRLARGKGLAPQLLEMGLEEMARCWGNTFEAFGEVRADNHASCRAFIRAGFQEKSPPGPEVRCFAKITRSAP